MCDDTLYCSLFACLSAGTFCALCWTTKVIFLYMRLSVKSINISSKKIIKITFTEEHVPHTQNRTPGKRPWKCTHEPFCHIQDGVNLLLAQVFVGHCRYFTKQCKQNPSIQLNRFLVKEKKKKVKKFTVEKNWRTSLNLKAKFTFAKKKSGIFFSY